MKWIKNGKMFDTETSRLVFAFPEKPSYGFGYDDPYGHLNRDAYRPRALGVRARQPMRDPKIWETLDGHFFMTANEHSFSLNEDQTDVNYYHEWDDPSRSPEEINDCCQPIKSLDRVKKIVEPHVSAEAYEALFGPVPSPAEVAAQTSLALEGLAADARAEGTRTRAR